MRSVQMISIIKAFSPNLLQGSLYNCITRLKIKSHDQAWEPCFRIEEKLKLCQNDRYGQLELQDDFSRVEHTMCSVEADALSASWQKRRLAMRICMHEVIIHISTCSTYCHGNKHLLTEAGILLSVFLRGLWVWQVRYII